MPFKDYNELVEPLELPINGKVYRIPPIGLEAGIRLAAATAPDAPAEDRLSDEEAFPLALGTALDEMRADHVTPAAINRAFLATMADWKRDRATAQIIWEVGADPKAIQALSTKLQHSTPAVAARTTHSQASTSGTTRKKSSK
jgi:hypothetical protein